MTKKTNMKKLVEIIAMAIALVMMMTVVANAANAYEQQPVYQNSAGRRVLDITYNGSIVLEVLAKGGNVYNATNRFLVTNNCKGPDYVGVVHNSTQGLVILWVDTAGTLWRTPASYLQNIAQGQYAGGPINSLTSSYYQGNQSTTPTVTYPTNTYPTTTYPTQQTYPNYGYGYGYGYNDNNYEPNYNYSNRYDAYVKVSGNTYKVYVDNDTYTYKLKSNGELTYGNSSSTEIADDVEAIAFTDEYLLYFNEDNEAWAVELGKKSRGDQILDDIEKVTYKSGSGLLDYIKADGDKYDEGDIEDLIDDYDNDKDDDDDYPYVRKSSNRYTYYKSSSRKYVYEFDGDIVEYDGREVLDDVDEIGFSDNGYLYLLTADNDLYQVKVGSRNADKVDSNIDRMKVSSYIVTYVYDENDKKIDIDDYE